MTYYSVLEVTPTNGDWAAAYVAETGEIVRKHGGKYLARTANHQRLEGDGEAVALRIILEWQSKEGALAFMSDPDYLPHLQARTAGSISHHFLIEGTDDLSNS